MLKPRFFAGERFNWNGRIFEVIRGLPTDEIIVRDTRTTIIVAVDFTEIVMQYVLQKLDAAKKENEAYGASDYPLASMKVAQFRKAVLDIVLKIPVRNRHDEIQKLVEQLRAEPRRDDKKPLLISRSTIYHWLHDYEKSNHDIRSLLPDTASCGGKGKYRLADAVERILSGVIAENQFAVDKAASVTEVLRIVNGRIREENRQRSDDQKLANVSRATVGRRMQDQNRT